MGTRGACGFHRGGVDKITYNHCDSYPEYLGKNVVHFVRETPITELHHVFDSGCMVDERAKPSIAQIEECRRFANLDVGNQRISDWYCLLREAQGNLTAYKQGLRYMIDDAEFLKDSLFCEWAYLINLDTARLEVYRGFQKTPQSNRYHTEPSQSGYCNCKLLAEFPLAAIPDDWLEQVESLDVDEDE